MPYKYCERLLYTVLEVLLSHSLRAKPECFVYIPVFLKLLLDYLNKATQIQLFRIKFF